jgi:hypothetical protein
MQLQDVISFLWLEFAVLFQCLVGQFGCGAGWNPARGLVTVGNPRSWRRLAIGAQVANLPHRSKLTRCRIFQDDLAIGNLNQEADSLLVSRSPCSTYSSSS